MVIKLVITSNPDLATIGITAVSFLNYMHKRSTNQDAKDSGQPS